MGSLAIVIFAAVLGHMHVDVLVLRSCKRRRVQRMRPLLRRDPESTRKAVGLALYLVLIGLGGLFILALFILPALASNRDDLEAMGIGALCALPALAVYIWIPKILDRFDPEPWWALGLVLLWGGVGAVGFSGLINTAVQVGATAVGGKEIGALVASCVSAPLVEEFFKGLGVFGVFYFLRREFDGVVDGVIYATFVALGFACIENIVYYQRAVIAGGGEQLATLFVLRGILSPWGHPLYTSMTGIGLGMARESDRTWVRWLAPLGGYGAAVFLHSVWNTSATISGMLWLVMLPLWLLFLAAFLVILGVLVRRKGLIIREFLQDEVLLGNMTPEELSVVASAFGGWKATASWGGAPGRQFVEAASRLGLSKWHSARAMRGRKMTVSAEFIAPLRQELHRLRDAIGRATGRPRPQPQPWNPGYGVPQAGAPGWQGRRR
jgi:RsiW-degrading membrane proteinase PrsW (M82 family)